MYFLHIEGCNGSQDAAATFQVTFPVLTGSLTGQGRLVPNRFRPPIYGIVFF